jgi:DNA-nicking Smr family endonuclease
MSRRRLSDDERALWKGVTRSIKPLRLRIGIEPDVDPPPPAVEKPKRSAAALPASAGVGARSTPAQTARPPSPLPLAPLGRRLRKRVARGSHALDGRIDLHGLTQAEAHDALLGYLRRAQAGGGRLVLVITGKGAATSDRTGERGVLRRQVPYWLRLPDFRAMVIGFEPAAISHGGEGALYVRLRAMRAEE